LLLKTGCPPADGPPPDRRPFAALPPPFRHLSAACPIHPDDPDLDPAPVMNPSAPTPSPVGAREPASPRRPTRQRSPRPGLAAAAASLLLVGCASVALPPAPPVADSAPMAWQAPRPLADAAAAPVSAAQLRDWWQRFDDPLLPELVAAAQAASPALAGALTRIAGARATRAAAAGALIPAAGVGARATQSRQLPGAPTATTLDAGIQASWEMDLFGGLGAAADAAQARVAGAEAGWHAARAALAAETASIYLALRACEASTAQTALDVQSRAETARLTGLSADAGFIAPAEAALARAGAAQARSTLTAQRARCDQLVKALVEITALPEPALRQRLLAGTATLPSAPALLPAELPAQTLAQRPDVYSAGLDVLAAAGDVAAAAARQRPQITLAGNLIGLQLRSGGETVRGATWSLGPLQIAMPLLDSGALAAATAAARVAYDESLVAYQAQLRRAVRDVESALVALQASTERQADTREAAERFEESLRATAARQQGGLASLFELEDARRNAVSAQLALIELERERTEAWITLYRALGGGWEEGAPVPAPATGAVAAAR
jgi:outer membrane protein, multidrug efflux system